MQNHADKNTELQSKPAAHDLSKKQNGSAGMQVADNRPEAVAQRKLQEVANNSMQVKKLGTIQSLANNFVSSNLSIQKKAGNICNTKKPFESNIHIDAQEKNNLVKSGTAPFLSLNKKSNAQKIEANKSVVQLVKKEEQQQQQQQSKAEAANKKIQEQKNIASSQQTLTASAAAVSSVSPQESKQQDKQKPAIEGESTKFKPSLTITGSGDTMSITVKLTDVITDSTTITIPSTGLPSNLLQSLSNNKATVQQLVSNITNEVSALSNETKKEKRQKIRGKITALLDSIRAIKSKIEAEIAKDAAEKEQLVIKTELSDFQNYLIQKKANAVLVSDVMNSIIQDLPNVSKKYDAEDILKLKDVWHQLRSLTLISNIHSPGPRKIEAKQRGRDSKGNVVTEKNVCFILNIKSRSYNIHVEPK